jgi:hypothetical protein
MVYIVNENRMSIEISISLFDGRRRSCRLMKSKIEKERTKRKRIQVGPLFAFSKMNKPCFYIQFFI